MSGIPIKLLHEAVGFKVTVELVSGDSYQGVLTHVEENMNLSLSDVIHTEIDGNIVEIGSAFIRGTNVLSVKVPDMLIHSSLFQDSKGQPPKSSMVHKIKRNFMTAKLVKSNKTDTEWHQLFHDPNFQFDE